MNKSWIVGAVLATLIGAPALAADLRPVKAPPPPAPTPNWTGFYLGLNGGGGLASVRLDDQCFFCNSHTPARSFGTFGGQIGYNYQFGNGLLGVEADVNWNSLKNRGLLGGDDGSAMNVEVKAEVSGTIRARAGLALNNTLIYATGGAAWADVKQTGIGFNNNTKVPDGNTANSSGTLWGAVGGVGAEFMFNQNWIFRVEYLHTMYTNRDTVLLAPNGAPLCGANRTCWVSNQLNTDVVRAALSYKF